MSAPDVVLLCGLPASGKTTTARRVHEHAGGVLIRSCDVYRDLGIDLPAWVRRTAAFTRGVEGYERERDQAYVEMTKRLEAALADGRGPIVVDAVHAERARRDEAVALCRAYGVTPLWLWCRCDVNETRQRLRDRVGHESEPENEAAHMCVYEHLVRLWDDPLADRLDGAPAPLVSYDTLGDRLAVLRGDGVAAVRLVRAALARPLIA